MIYEGEWIALRRRIDDMAAAGESALARPDALGSIRHLRHLGNQIFQAIAAYRQKFATVLPTDAIACIEQFMAQSGSVITGTAEHEGMERERLSSGVTRFKAFAGEMTFHLSDTQPTIRARSELAFVHLQRLIAADADIRDKWQDAFDVGETECEALGAVHLLSHGIWAFKAHAGAARTDLVFQEPVDVAKVERVAEGLVLTEWKKLTSPGQAEKAFAEARDQARRYACGVLAGNELRRYRYAVVVSQQEVRCPDDVEEDGVVYRHINVAVRPRTPSKAKN